MALLGDRVLVRRGEPPVANDDPALHDHEPRGPRSAERERRDRVLARSGEGKAVHAESAGRTSSLLYSLSVRLEDLPAVFAAARRSSLVKNFREVWPKTTPAKAEYWRMTQTPE